MAEFASCRIAFATVANFDGDEFVTDENEGQSVIRQDEIIAVDRIQSDIAFATDL